MHGGLHECEVCSWLAMRGRNVRSGYESPLTAGVVDVLPTVLHFLNIDIPDHLQGRLLREGLEAYADNDLPETSKDLQFAAGAGGYRAFIELDIVGKYHYLRRAWVETCY